MSGVTAAATGAIAGAVVVLGRRAMVDGASVAIGMAAMGLILAWRRFPEPVVILAAGGVGLLWRGMR